jgi:hypothetical protein
MTATVDGWDTFRSRRFDHEDGKQQQLRDLQQTYNAHFDSEKACLSQNIGLEWNDFPEI